MADDKRGCVYVDAAINADDVRTYYEVSEGTAERIHRYAGDEDRTLTFDQACEAMCDELVRVLQCYGALREWTKALDKIAKPGGRTPGIEAAMDRVFDRAEEIERRERGDDISGAGH